MKQWVMVMRFRAHDHITPQELVEHATDSLEKSSAFPEDIMLDIYDLEVYNRQIKFVDDEAAVDQT